jgi:ferrous iron transport protein B
MSQAHADCPHCRQDGSEAKHIALKEVRIALAGNPNCGKTTAFNEYTGTHQHVGNYPGVTVDKKEGYVSIDGVEVLMVDLPGTYSLTAYSQEEIVTRAVLAPEKAEEKPMAVVDLVDTSALERNLFLTVQIMEMGLPVVLACNMMDEARKAGIQVDTKELGKQLGIPVVATVARSGEGLKDALREAIAFGRRGSAPLNISYGPDLDPVLTKMERLLAEKGLLTDRYPTRWIALKVLENDSEILRQVERMPDVAAQLRADRETVADHLRDTLQTSPEAIIADYRYGFIRGVLRSGAVRRESAKDRLELSDKLDKVLTNTLFGPLIMLGVLYAMFQLTFVIGAYPQGWVEDGFGWLGETVSALMPDGFLKSLIVSGVIDGLGGVMSFVPLIIIMFTLVAILEDFGYMARMAYMLDRVFRAFGLHGASVMPFIIAGGIAGGCAIPGVMATRTLRSPKEKLATLLTLPYMACGAKLPVFLLLVGVFFPENPARTMFLLTLAGWAAALLMARLMRSTIIRGESTPFVMELPPYRVPTLRSVVTHCWERTWMYLKKAGTVLVAVSILIWASMTFPTLDPEQAAPLKTQIAALQEKVDALPEGDEARTPLEEELAAVQATLAEESLQHSWAGRLGMAIEPLTKPVGFDWRTDVALIGGQGSHCFHARHGLFAWRAGS